MRDMSVRGTFAPTAIRASAGSGKTFQLTNRFLSLLCRGVPIDRMLATTFTRKAAGEILSRVLARLAKAAGDAQECEELARFLQLPGFDRGAAVRLLRRLAEHLHRIRIATLDSFFSQLAGSYCLEIGLPPGWSILDEVADQHLWSEAIREVLADDPEEVTTLVRLLTMGIATRSVSDQIRDAVRSMYGTYLETTAEAWRILRRESPMAEQRLAETIDLISRYPLTDKRAREARDKDLDFARQRDWKSFLEKGLANKVLSGEATYYGKPLDAELVDAYEALIGHVRAVFIERLADQTEASHKLLEKFHVAYERLKMARRGLRFEDVTRALANAGLLRQDRGFHFRLDASLDHLLLDEFQDTSLSQWEVLAPLAKQFVAASRAENKELPAKTFFAVGDGKQAIYGWRGGLAEIFDALGRQLPGLTWTPMGTSFRSSPVIIDVVNQVFEGIGENQALSNHREAARGWNESFDTHETALANLPGYCTLESAPFSEGTDPAEWTTLQYAARRVAQIVEEAKGRSIGMLVRDNKAVARLIHELRQLGVHASEEGGNPITDSAAVTVILSLLALADHPGDTVARFHVATSPLGPVVGLSESSSEEEVVALAQRLREQLLARGYGRTLLGWARELAPPCQRRDRERLMALVDLGFRHDPEATMRPGDFVAQARFQKIDDPTSADVRVMTIHQSKGLEFDIVVLPQLEKPLLGQTPSFVVGRRGAAEPITGVVRYANKEICALLPPEIQSMFADYRNRVARESLCLLYVAMTRAAHALHMILSPPRRPQRELPGTFAGVLRGALLEGKSIEPESILFEKGDPRWHASRTPEEPLPLQVAEATSLKAPMKSAPSLAARKTRNLARHTPSGMEGGSLVHLRSRFRLETNHALERGSCLHSFFESLGWLEDGALKEADLSTITEKLGINGERGDRYRSEFLRMVENPAFREVLSRDAFLSKHRRRLIGEETLDLWRERPFAVRRGDELWTGTFDRVVLVRLGKKLLFAEIQDYKTDGFAADDADALAARVAYYLPQMTAYREALHVMTGLATKDIGCALLFVAAEKLIRVNESADS